MAKRFYLVVYFLTVIHVCFSQVNDSLRLSSDQVAKLASLPLHCAEVEYPNKLNQVLTDSTYLQSPEHLHPIFYGCFDWHSSVHGFWLLAKSLNTFPEMDRTTEIIDLFDRQFTAEKVAIELAYFEPKTEKSFERTYGWAWLLKLQEELLRASEIHGKSWAKNLQPLADFIAESYMNFLPKLVYPIRVGEHTNTAFGLSLALDYAISTGHADLKVAIMQRAMDYYKNDCDCPLVWEPSGFDFLSPCLQEAELMSKVLNPEDFESWMKQFLPALFKKDFSITPGMVLDRTDGKLVHLDGLNFSRAWCFYVLAKMLPKQQNHFIELGDRHVRASMNYVVDSDYMGSHWLATFMMYALDKRSELVK